MNSKGSKSLRDRLEKVLPAGYHFKIHHLSTPPTKSQPLYAAPPGDSAEETYCECHFLSVSIDLDGRSAQVFAIEVLIYSTEFLTTLFVSKADSTGYLYRLNLPTDTPSPLKNISTAFLCYLVTERKRSDRRLVLSLFARAQNQYLFPGSIENKHKHVLDDRGLIKWWCKVVDPILASYHDDKEALGSKGPDVRENHEFTSHGYLRVPGCEKYETRDFLPKDDSKREHEKRRWYGSDPLCMLGKSANLPERCLIPRFPDDPKARFLEQLDEELSDEDTQHTPTSSKTFGSHPRRKNAGRWRSVKSLEEFWEMMSFRQECSSGRLVGFLWAVFQPAGLLRTDKAIDEVERSLNPAQNGNALPIPEVSQNNGSNLLPPQSPLRSSPIPELPSTPSKALLTHSPQTPAPTPHKVKVDEIEAQPEETRHYFWPTSSRGEIVLRQKDYQRLTNLLVHLDYADEELALESSRKWTNDVAERAGSQSWGQDVIGTVSLPAKANLTPSEAAPTMLNAGLIRKKKRSTTDSDSHCAEAGNAVNVLSTGLVRKKPKMSPNIGNSSI